MYLVGSRLYGGSLIFQRTITYIYSISLMMEYLQLMISPNDEYKRLTSCWVISGMDSLSTASLIALKASV